ncbi:hypothetical protein [Muricoccus vinaceus]|uniref:Uncharacterized protein n=1 Tax=Muricoccus vinaceus TaxID=424704 RepID=A0ABV6J0G2_9PROT
MIGRAATERRGIPAGPARSGGWAMQRPAAVAASWPTGATNSLGRATADAGRSG